MVAGGGPRYPVLVTGAGGFIGRHVLARRLQQDGRVFGLSRMVARSDIGSLRSPGIELRALPSDGPPQPALFDGVGAVIHAAGLAHRPDASKEDHERLNRRLTLETAQAAAEAGVRRFVFVSSIAVHGLAESDSPVASGAPVAPDTAYGVAKMEAERGLSELATQTGLEVVVVRPALVCGPRAPGNPAKLARAVATGLPLPLGRLDNRRSLIDVDDLADLLLRCIDADAAAGRTYMAGDPDTLSTTEIVTEIAAGLEKPARLLRCPTRTLRLLGSLTGRKRMIQQLTGTLTVDAQASIDELGWTPAVGVRGSLRALGKCQRELDLVRSRN